MVYTNKKNDIFTILLCCLQTPNKINFKFKENWSTFFKVIFKQITDVNPLSINQVELTNSNLLFGMLSHI